MTTVTGPSPVGTIAQLPEKERGDCKNVWIEIKKTLQEDNNIPSEDLEPILKQTAESVNEFALNRGFHDVDQAQKTPIKVIILLSNSKKQPESIAAAISRSIISSVASVVGWEIASSNLAIGVAVAATAFVVNTQSSQQQIQKLKDYYYGQPA
jgi:hypothetical protein